MIRLLNIRPGEAKKLALLYGLHFVFYVGLRWGDNSGYILFLNSWDAIAMSLIFMVVFLAEILLELQGRAAIDHLVRVATKRGPAARAGILDMIGADWFGDTAVRELCCASLSDPVSNVRRAAVAALGAEPATAHDEALLAMFLNLLDDPDEDVRAGVIPPLIASGDFFFLAPAVRTLAGWLEDPISPANRALGLRVLARTGDVRLAQMMVRYLDDPSPLVRMQAIDLIDDLYAVSSHEALGRLGVEKLSMQLADPDEAVRLAVVGSLGHFTSPGADQALLAALSDNSFEVRRRACDLLPPRAFESLDRALDSDNIYLAECSAYVLARAETRRNPVGGLRARRHAQERIETLAHGAYAIHLQRQALRAYTTPGARLLLRMLRERADQLLDRGFWLVGALGDPAESQDIRRALRSDSATTRANAAEALESLTSPQVARLLAPLVEVLEIPALSRIGMESLHLPPVTLEQIFKQTWLQVDSSGVRPATHGLIYDDGWLAAVTLYMLLETPDAVPAGSRLASPAAIRAILERTTSGQASAARATAHAMMADLKTVDRRSAAEQSMLTIIERVIFLKQVPVFGGMIIDRLRVLASISEEQESPPARGSSLRASMATRCMSSSGGAFRSSAATRSGPARRPRWQYSPRASISPRCRYSTTSHTRPTPWRSSRRCCCWCARPRCWPC